MTVLKWGLGIAVLVLTSQRALALPIGAGGQIQQIPPAPVQQQPPPALPVPQQPAVVPVASGTIFTVRQLQLTGQTHFSQAELLNATGFKPGSAMNLSGLQEMAARITNYYNKRGYFLARAYLPAQDITDGIVTISVAEGYYGQIGIKNKSNVSDVVLVRILDGIDSGDTIQAAPLERRLLLISDLPGIKVNATLTPGAKVGTADMSVGVTQGPRVDGDVEADNWGNPYTGAYRVGGTLNWNEPFGHGDVLSLRTLESTDGDMDYLRLSYQTQLWDATVGAALTGFKYRLGKQFEELDANGWEGIASLYGSYPLIRSYTSNLYLQADLDQRFFQDNIGAYSVSTDKRATVLTTSISGNQADGFGGGGWTDYSLASVMGDLSIESPAAREIDAVTAKTNGVYAKIVASVSRLQNIYGPLTLYVSARGQLADKNLDVSEKMELGGATGVRAYPEGEAYGDDGYIITIEPHLQLPVPPHFPGTLQAIAFVDTGYVKIYHTPFSNAQNGLTRTGAGVGLNWTGPYGLVANVTYADLLGDNKATSYPDNSGEIWFQIIKYF